MMSRLLKEVRVADFLTEAASAARKAGMTAGAGAGLAASGSVWTTAMASGTAAIVSPAVLCIALPIAGAWLGWKAVKKVTDLFD
jgi:hypothetical protein